MVFKPSAVLKARINAIAEDGPNQD
jgi:hypothetical protein